MQDRGESRGAQEGPCNGIPVHRPGSREHRSQLAVVQSKAQLVRLIKRPAVIEENIYE